MSPSRKGKLPSLKLMLQKVQKLLVGVSVDWSIAVRLLTVKSFPFPDTSAPRLAEFSKSK
jgi:hypothetical protein